MIKHYLYILVIIFNCYNCAAQIKPNTTLSTSEMSGRDYKAPPMKCDNLTIISKTKELVEASKAQGFYIFNGGFYELKNENMFPIMVHLKQKTVYHFIVVGQPDLEFLEVGLGHEAFDNDEVRDRIRKKRDKTYYTEFTYVPPFEGNYLLSVTEEVKDKRRFSTAIYVMIKPNAVTQNE
jgi:hypothetical protein